MVGKKIPQWFLRAELYVAAVIGSVMGYVLLSGPVRDASERLRVRKEREEQERKDAEEATQSVGANENVEVGREHEDGERA
jgi:hypothetical protein